MFSYHFSLKGVKSDNPKPFGLIKQPPLDPIRNLPFSYSLHFQTCPQGKEKPLSAFISVHLRPIYFASSSPIICRRLISPPAKRSKIVCFSASTKA